MQNAHGAGEAQLPRAARHRQRVLRIFHAAAQHGIDVHLKHGVLGQQLQFLIEHLEALFGDFVGHRVVDADLQILEPGAVQPLNAFGRQQVAVRDDPRQDSVAAHPRDDLVKLRMQQRLAAADRHDRRAHLRQTIDPPEHFGDLDWLREIVEFIAIRAGKIASPDRNDVHQQRMPR